MPIHHKDLQTVEFSTPLKVPKVWNTLLAIENFDDLPVLPEKASTRRDEDNFDPTPYRDDNREEYLANDEYEICLALVSGGNNYFLLYTIWKKGKEQPIYNSGDNGDVFFDLPVDSDSIILSNGLTFEFRVEQVEHR